MGDGSSAFTPTYPARTAIISCPPSIECQRTIRTVRLCLVGVAFALVLIGVVSGTPVRYLIQVAPIALAMPLLARSPGSLGAYAAVALFSYWMLAMVLIWLFLLDLSDLARDQYAPIEVGLTMFVAFFCSVGILLGVRAGRLLGRTHRIATVATF